MTRNVTGLCPRPYSARDACWSALFATLFTISVPMLECSFSARSRLTFFKVEYTNGTVTDIKLSDDTRTVTSAAVRLVDGSSTNIECDMFVGMLLPRLSSTTGILRWILSPDCTGTSQAGLKWLSRALPTHAANRLTAIKQEYQVQVRAERLAGIPID